MKAKLKNFLGSTVVLIIVFYVYCFFGRWS